LKEIERVVPEPRVVERLLDLLLDLLLCLLLCLLLDILTARVDLCLVRLGRSGNAEGIVECLAAKDEWITGAELLEKGGGGVRRETRIQAKLKGSLRNRCGLRRSLSECDGRRVGRGITLSDKDRGLSDSGGCLSGRVGLNRIRKVKANTKLEQGVGVKVLQFLLSVSDCSQSMALVDEETYLDVVGPDIGGRDVGDLVDGNRGNGLLSEHGLSGRELKILRLGDVLRSENRLARSCVTGRSRAGGHGVVGVVRDSEASARRDVFLKVKVFGAFDIRRFVSLELGLYLGQDCQGIRLIDAGILDVFAVTDGADDDVSIFVDVADVTTDGGIIGLSSLEKGSNNMAFRDKTIAASVNVLLEGGARGSRTESVRNVVPGDSHVHEFHLVD
jgi:hypothetical protein